MSFISYNKNYYIEFLNRIENSKPSKEDVYLAKQLLKMVEDFEDEGYTDLRDCLNEFNGKQRLKDYILSNNEKPFELITNKKVNPEYVNVMELNSFINELISFKGDYKENDFINDLVSFTNSISIDDDTTYVFLLRDTLIPYLIFKSNGANNCHPYLIGRRMLEDISAINNVDDMFRKSIIEALEKSINNYHDFEEYVVNDIKNTLREVPSIDSTLKQLLMSITSRKIMVIESGVYGTIPMLLKAIDARVDFKMYTTVPYLKDIYKDRIYTVEYEKIRQFETLVC